LNDARRRTDCATEEGRGGESISRKNDLLIKREGRASEQRDKKAQDGVVRTRARVSEQMKALGESFSRGEKGEAYAG